MLSVYVDSKNKATTAVISDSELDVLKMIIRRMGCNSLLDNVNLSERNMFEIMDSFCLNKVKMPKKNRATVKCDERDVFETETGRREAIAKAQKNYHKSVQKALRRWQTAMIKKVYTINPETFQKAIEMANNDIERSNEKRAKKAN